MVYVHRRSRDFAEEDRNRRIGNRHIDYLAKNDLTKKYERDTNFILEHGSYSDLFRLVQKFASRCLVSCFIYLTFILLFLFYSFRAIYCALRNCWLLKLARERLGYKQIFKRRLPSLSDMAAVLFSIPIPIAIVARRKDKSSRVCVSRVCR